MPVVAVAIDPVGDEYNQLEGPGPGAIALIGHHYGWRNRSCNGPDSICDEDRDDCYGIASCDEDSDLDSAVGSDENDDDLLVRTEYDRRGTMPSLMALVWRFVQ